VSPSWSGAVLTCRRVTLAASPRGSVRGVSVALPFLLLRSCRHQCVSAGPAVRSCRALIQQHKLSPAARPAHLLKELHCVAHHPALGVGEGVPRGLQPLCVCRADGLLERVPVEGSNVLCSSVRRATGWHPASAARLSNTSTRGPCTAALTC
jgi:hypothetical protein